MSSPPYNSFGGGFNNFQPQMQSPYGPQQNGYGGYGGYGPQQGFGGGFNGGFGGYGPQQGFGGYGPQQGFGGGFGPPQQQGFGGGFGGFNPYQQQDFGGGFNPYQQQGYGGMMGGFNPYQMQSPYGPQQGGMFGGPQMQSPYGRMGGGMGRGYGGGFDRQVGNQGMAAFQRDQRGQVGSQQLGTPQQMTMDMPQYAPNQTNTRNSMWAALGANPSIME